MSNNKKQKEIMDLYMEVLKEMGQDRGISGSDFDSDLIGDDGKPRVTFKEIVYRILDKVKYIIAAAIIGGIIAWIITAFLITPKYTATSKIFIFDKNSALTTASLQIGSSLTADYAQVFRNHEVHEKVIENLGLGYSTGYLESNLVINNPSETRILFISYTDSSPELACNIANEYSKVARDFIKRKMSPSEEQGENDASNLSNNDTLIAMSKMISGSDYGIVNEFESAIVPKTPSSPNMPRNIMLGIIAGVFISVLVLGIIVASDDKIHSSEEIENYFGIPSLGLMPIESGQLKKRNKRVKIKNNNRNRQLKKPKEIKPEISTEKALDEDSDKSPEIDSTDLDSEKD